MPGQQWELRLSTKTSSKGRTQLQMSSLPAGQYLIQCVCVCEKLTFVKQPKNATAEKWLQYCHFKKKEWLAMEIIWGGCTALLLTHELPSTA